MIALVPPIGTKKPYFGGLGPWTNGTGGAGRENIWLEVRTYGPCAARSVPLTESQIFSLPARPHLVNKHFIM